MPHPVTHCALQYAAMCWYIHRVLVCFFMKSFFILVLVLDLLALSSCSAQWIACCLVGTMFPTATPRVAVASSSRSVLSSVRRRMAAPARTRCAAPCHATRSTALVCRRTPQSPTSYFLLTIYLNQFLCHQLSADCSGLQGVGLAVGGRLLGQVRRRRAEADSPLGRPGQVWRRLSVRADAARAVQHALLPARLRAGRVARRRRLHQGVRWRHSAAVAPRHPRGGARRPTVPRAVHAPARMQHARLPWFVTSISSHPCLCSFFQLRCLYCVDVLAEKPVDCVVSDWVDQGKCSLTCGGGLQTQVRHVVHPARHGGSCPRLTRQLPCNTQPCPADCQLSPWHEVGQCSAPCGGGQQRQVRQVEVPAANGGKCVAPLERHVPCNTHACPVDCTLGSWQSEGKCSATCGGGSIQQHRKVSFSFSCQFDSTRSQFCQLSTSLSSGAEVCPEWRRV